MNNGKKEGQPAGKGVKGGFAVKRGVVAEISPKKSQGRALNRPSVMGRVCRAGGLCVLWQESFKLSVMSYSLNHIYTVIEGVGPCFWRFTGVYGFSKVEERYWTWDLIRSLAQGGTGLWLLGGDFNEILRSSEKEGGPPRDFEQMEAFQKCLDDCGLIDLNFSGPVFTWKGKRAGELVKTRLDRFVANKEWKEVFSASRVTHMKPSRSDHVPLGIEILTTRVIRRVKRKRFHIEEFWLRDAECIDVVRNGRVQYSGGDLFQAVCHKIDRTRRALWDWSNRKFGSLKKEIEKTRGRLAVYYDRARLGWSDQERVQLEKRLNELMEHEHNYWKQRARIMWLTEAEAEVQDIVLHYYGQLFTSCNPRNVDLFTCLFPTVVSQDMNNELTRAFTEEEVLKALKQMHPLKAPGPNGFSPIFYQKYWHIVGKDVTTAVWIFMNSDELIRQVNGTYVTMIPKVKVVEHITQLRPISLCNVLYKLGSKVLANRLKPILKSVIAPNQSAFVPRRHISNNSILAFEISHHLKRMYGGGNDFGVLKLDMSKAYDRVKWGFLEEVMRSMGFHGVWIGWVMRCIKTVSYSFILNGEPRGNHTPTRGLRQGDSISPYLFLLCAKGLSRMLTYAEMRGGIHGVSIATGAPSINHLFFADDSFIFLRAEVVEWYRLKHILQVYEEALGQQVHFQKSSISFSRNVAREAQDRLASLLGVERVDKHDKYLGLPTELSYSKKESFQYIMDKTRDKMKNWKDKTLSAAKKEVMIKAVVQSVPTYVMSVLEVLKHICNEMHRCMAEFWWGDSDRGRKIHWVAWDKMCAPKNEGGLGFRNMELFNQALLAKKGWRIINSLDSLVTRTLKAKYFPSGHFLKAEMGSDASYVWRSLLKGRDLLRKGIRYHVGNGESISVWHDPWILRPCTFKTYSTVMEGLEDLKVADLIDPDTRVWMVDWLNELFFEDEVEVISLSFRNPDDQLIWHYDKHGLYTVRRGYYTARCALVSQQQASTSAPRNSCDKWKAVWKVKVQPKIKCFIWRLLKDSSSTRSALAHRIALEDQSCLFCRCAQETSMHVFKDCQVIACMWLCSPLGLRARNQEANSKSDWFEIMMETLQKSQLEVFVMLLWAIWTGRNNILWKEAQFDPAHTVRWSLKLLEEYHQANPGNSNGRKSRAAAKWEFPPPV
ncbi:PREDICTED: uncharacterized protein LOC101298860 [Fragaria vesca subsp. vesca]